MKVFIDSNIPMYVAGAAHPSRDPARRFLAQVQTGSVEGCSSTEVLQEILYRYSAVGRRDLARPVYDLFVSICPTLYDVTLADTDVACDLLGEFPSLSARDCVHAAVMANHGIELIATYDQAFDMLPHVHRVELP